jgi:hypothetical protein
MLYRKEVGGPAPPIADMSVASWLIGLNNTTQVGARGDYCKDKNTASPTAGASFL